MDYNKLATEHHKMMRDKGFWDNEGISIKEKLMLVIGEFSEAAEEIRSGHPSIYFNRHGVRTIPSEITLQCFTQEAIGDLPEGINKPEGWLVEVADAMLRALDLCAFFMVDVNKLIQTRNVPVEMGPIGFESHIMIRRLYDRKPLEAFRVICGLAANDNDIASAINVVHAIHEWVYLNRYKDDFEAILKLKMEFNSMRPRLHGRKF